MNPTIRSDEIQDMLRTCDSDVLINCHASGAIARKGDVDYPYLPSCKGTPVLHVPLGTVIFLIETLDVDRECAGAELPMLRSN